MNKKLFVGRLPFAFSDDQLRALFVKSGTVVSAVMVPDAKSGKTRGFGFVDMSTDAEAQAAIQTINGMSLEDKKIWVTLAREKGEAKPKESHAPARRPFGERRPFGDRPGPGSRRPFEDRSGGAPRFNTDRSPSRSAQGPKSHSPNGPANGRRPSGDHFVDGASRTPFGDRKPPFRGKRSFSDGPGRGPSSDSRPPFTGERKPFRSADARPSGPPRDGFRGPPKRAGGRRPQPRG